MEPFSTSVFGDSSTKYLLLPPRSAPDAAPASLTATSLIRNVRAPLLNNTLIVGQPSVGRLGAIHFQGWCIRQVSHNTVYSRSLPFIHLVNVMNNVILHGLFFPWKLFSKGTDYILDSLVKNDHDYPRTFSL